jgi:SWI/SNF-related matrix-associated actin-dependent regulator 1 of chromatin subfamily A
MQAKTYRISAGFAAKKGIPTTITAATLRETDKALYLYGHGQVDPKGSCAKCGKTLTHPGSILAGIGPDCLEDWGSRERLAENPTQAQIDYLQSLIRSQQVDTWLPKAVITDTMEAEGEVQVPADHPMTQQRRKSQQQYLARQVKSKVSGKRHIHISFPFNREIISRVKSLPGRRFNKDDKTWTCPLSLESVETLRELGFELDQALQDYLDQSRLHAAELDSDFQVPGLNGTLLPFQRQGVAFLEAKGGRGLIGDEMGLGKTVQALAWLQLHPEARPAVIVTPGSLKLNWAKEAAAWMTNANVQVLSGQDPTKTQVTGDVLVINYDILGNKWEKPKGAKQKQEVPYSGWVDYLRDLGAQTVVADEAHFFKNRDAKRTKGIEKLGDRVDHFIALTGTPIVNRPIEMYNAIKMVDPTIFPSRWKFAQRYCGATHNGFGWDFNGASNTQELHDKLVNTVMIRRRKADVLTELPDKLYDHIPLGLSNRSEYRKAEQDFIAWLKETKGAEKADKASRAQALAQINELKQLSVQGKLKGATEWIQDFLTGGEKLVVFGVHRKVLYHLQEVFGDQAVKVDGDTSDEGKDRAVELFQNDPNTRLFIGNVQAAGVGLTLTAASNVAFLELPWTPGDLQQAEDRCHRIGQDNAVTVYYLLAENSIETEIAQAIDEKREILDQVLDGEDVANSPLLTDLMSEYAALG